MATKVAPPPKAPRKPRREPFPETPDPIDIAMLAAVSGKPIPDVARKVLEEEARLIRAQCTELRLREIGERVRAALWAILAVAALVIVGLIITVVVKAARSDALVVESFRVPPAMAQQGLTGEVVAQEVLDKIAEYQSKTGSIRAATSYDNNWGQDIKIDIPDTGATADQLWKLLREWLGKETRISGEVIQTRDGLALTTRVGALPGQRFVSKTNDLDDLVGQGASMIYKNTQPYRYAIYAMTNGHEPEGRAVLQTLATDPSPRERKWAFIGLGWDAANAGQVRKQAEMPRRALAIDPNMLNALFGLAGAESALGHMQSAVDVAAKAVQLPVSSEYNREIAHAQQCNFKGQLGWLMRDPVLADQAADCLDTAPAGGPASLPRAIAQILRHESQPLMAYMVEDNASLTNVERAEDNAEMHLYGQMERGPSPALAQALEDLGNAVAAEVADPKVGAGYRAGQVTYIWPLEAQAFVELGRNAEAAALIAKTPLDCYNCIRTRGMVAEAQGNLPEAQRWFLEAAKQGPRLSPAFVDWGRLMIHARHFDAAIPKLARAAQLSPNWADPLKYWGDALAAEGRRDEARAKYDAALKLAPKWEELQHARARLLHAA